MGREYAQLRVDMLADARFRSLSEGAQRLYMILLAMPTLSYCGVGDYRPKRLAGYSSTSTPESIMLAAAELSAKHYVVVDDEFEEILLRSYVKYDGVMKQPRLAVSMANAYASVISETIRSVIAFELNELRGNDPTLAAWDKPAVAAILGHEMQDAKSLSPYSPVVFPVDSAKVSPEFGPNVGEALAPVSDMPTTSTATSTSNMHLETSANEVRDEVMGLCVLLQQLIVENGSKPPVISDKWLTDARLMLDKDGRDLQTTIRLIRWTQASTFWRGNVMSMPTFRAKYDQLRQAANHEIAQKKKSGGDVLQSNYDLLESLKAGAA